MQGGININKERTIYLIVNTVNNKEYVGVTMNLNRRKLDHLTKLRKNIHVNKLIQSDFAIYGEKSFEFYALCRVNGWKESVTKEKRVIAERNTEINGYNLTGYKKPRADIKIPISTAIEKKYFNIIEKIVTEQGLSMKQWLYSTIMEKAKSEKMI